MSDEKKGLGLFVKSKTAKAAGGAPSAMPGKPKDVQKRWMYVGLGAIGLVVASTTIFGDKKSPIQQAEEAAKAKKPAVMVNVNPKGAEEAQFENKFGSDLARVQTTVEDLRKQAEAKDREIAKLKEEAEKKAASPAGAASSAMPTPPSGIVPPPSNTLDPLTPPKAVAPPAPPIPPVLPTAPRQSQGTPEVPPSMSAGAMPSIPPTTAMQGADPMIFDAPARAGRSGQALDASDPPTATGSRGGVKARVDYRRNDNAGLLPAGAFAPVALLNGLDAGTSSATQSNPLPVLMNVTDQATLPGAAKYRLKNCFVLGTGYGDLSAERVYIRFSRLSCIDKADKLVLSQEVAGYVVDSDGKLGMRGMVTDRQGAKLGKAMIAGFAQGLAGALGSAQSTVSSNLTTGSTTSTINGGAALRASGLAGAQTAASQLAEFYLREAQSIFPVITVDAGRTGTIVFSGSTALNWGQGEGQYVQNVQPTNN